MIFRHLVCKQILSRVELLYSLDYSLRCLSKSEREKERTFSFGPAKGGTLPKFPNLSLFSNCSLNLQHLMLVQQGLSVLPVAVHL